MTPGWIPDRPNNYQTIIRNPSKNDLPLPLELPQVTRKTPHDHQKMATEIFRGDGLWPLPINWGPGHARLLARPWPRRWAWVPQP